MSEPLDLGTLVTALSEARDLPGGGASVSASAEQLRALSESLKALVQTSDAVHKLRAAVESLAARVEVKEKDRPSRKPGRPATHRGAFIAYDYHLLHMRTYQEGVTVAQVINMVLDKNPSLREESKNPESYVDSAQRKHQEYAIDAIWLADRDATDEEIEAYRQHLLSHRHDAS